MKPKYNIGDEVWVLESQKAEKVKITGIRISKDREYLYSTRTPTGLFESMSINQQEEELFPSKEALVASL